MEEVRASSSPEEGQPNDELPEPLNTTPYQFFSQEQARPNTSSLHNSNLEATYDINTLPRPVEAAQTPEVPDVHEAEFDKRNERLRDVPRQQDELACAGMVALGDVLKDRQTTYTTPPSVPPTPRLAPPPLTPPVSHTSNHWSLYKQAIAIGLVAGLLIAPVIIVALARG